MVNPGLPQLPGMLPLKWYVVCVCVFLSWLLVYDNYSISKENYMLFIDTSSLSENEKKLLMRHLEQDGNVVIKRSIYVHGCML